MLTIKEFCENHTACEKGRDWAIAKCEDMQKVWATIVPEWLVWVATRVGVLSRRELRLFSCFCARQNWNRLTDDRSRNAIEVAERYANGNATRDELHAARNDASAVAIVAAAAAYASAHTDINAVAVASAAAVAAYASAHTDVYAVAAAAAVAAYASAHTNVNAAAYNAAITVAAVYSSADASATATARREQASWLRENTKPDFSGENHVPTEEGEDMGISL